MKKYIKLLLVFFISCAVNAQGIKFFHGSFDEAVALAQKENKQIFVDVYTTWCGPCKKMAATTFKDPQVGEYFDKNFISLKIDAENEAKSSFFKKYKATAFPSLFMLNSKGDLLDVLAGTLDGPQFIEYAKKSADKNVYGEYDKLMARWKSGERNSSLFQNLVVRLMPKLHPELIGDFNMEYAKSFSEQDLKSPEFYRTFGYYIRRPEDNFIFNTIAKNWDAYMPALKNSSKAWEDVYAGFVRKASALRNKKEDKAYQDLITLIKKTGFTHQEMIFDSMNFENLVFDKKYSQAIDEMNRLTQKYADMPFLYDSCFYTLIIGDYFVQENKNQADVDKVLAFARIGAKKRPTQRSMMFMAAAYANKGDYKTAYEYLGSISFYSEPKLSTALYKQLNLTTTKAEFPW